MIRQSIVTVLGHVDHGKTSLLDYIRSSRVQAKEHGDITQHIGATEVPSDFIKDKCTDFLKKIGIEITLPGLLFIDTPGHEAFMNLRRRGGSLADLAVLVIDVSQGFQPQTLESIEILKHFKVPFIIAANKIDLIPGWRSAGGCFTNSFENQTEDARLALETRIWGLVGKLGGLGFQSERFDRVSDFTKQVAIVPVCAKTGEGVMDLLAVISGLAQRFLQTQLKTASGPAKGTVLEVKVEKGLGTVLDAIIYDGDLSVGDDIVVAGVSGPLHGKVKLLLKPRALDEMRDPRDRFDRAKVVHAACGVRVVAQGCDDALAGSLLLSKEIPDAEKKVIEDVQSVKIETQGSGVVLKADALGSLEAIAGLLKDHGVNIRFADIGPISRKDIVEVEGASLADPFTAAVLGFQVKLLPDAEQLAKDKNIKIISGQVIYKLLEDYQVWVKENKEMERQKRLERLTRGVKFKILSGYVFRQSKPAVVGVEIFGGILKPGISVMRDDGKEVGHVKGLQEQNVNIGTAERGKQVAVSIDGPTVGRQINENDVLYSVINESEYKKLVELKELISADELQVLEEIKEIMRRTRKTWGM